MRIDLYTEDYPHTRPLCFFLAVMVSQPILQTSGRHGGRILQRWSQFSYGTGVTTRFFRYPQLATFGEYGDNGHFKQHYRSP